MGWGRIHRRRRRRGSGMRGGYNSEWTPHGLGKIIWQLRHLLPSLPGIGVRVCIIDVVLLPDVFVLSLLFMKCRYIFLLLEKRVMINTILNNKLKYLRPSFKIYSQQPGFKNIAYICSSLCLSVVLPACMSFSLLLDLSGGNSTILMSWCFLISNIIVRSTFTK